MYSNLYEEMIALPTSEGYTMTQLQNVVYIKSNGNYSEVHLRDETKILLTRQLSELESFLLNCPFIRVHQQYLVNKFQVSRYIRADSQLVLTSGVHIPIAARKRRLITTFFKTLF